MENNLENTISSVHSNGSRQRKSIFSLSKPTKVIQQPTIKLNGQNIQLNHQRVYTSDSNFYPINNTTQNVFTRNFNNQSTGFIPHHIINIPNQQNRMIKDHSPVITKCIRPVSLNRSNNIVHHQNMPVFSHQIHQNTILTNSRVIPSQTSNVFVQRQNLIKQPHLFVVQSAPIINPIQVKNISPQQIHSRVFIKQTIPQVTKVIIKDDPKNISEINKLTLLNQYLNNQYCLTNNQLSLIKQKIYQKQFIEDRIFLERSLNTIDDIFLCETNEALNRLDEITRKSTKTLLTKASSHKRFKQLSHNASYTKIINNNNNNLMGYNSPIKNVEHSRIDICDVRY